MSSGPIISGKPIAHDSWHNMRVAQPIYEKLHTQTPPGCHLVTDTAFPQGIDQLVAIFKFQ